MVAHNEIEKISIFIKEITIWEDYLQNWKNFYLFISIKDEASFS
jgi:hypothetical protein